MYKRQAEAVQNGLVDEIGNIEDALIYAALSIEGVNSLSEVQILEYPKPQTTMEMLLESFGQGKSVFSGTPFEGVEAAFRNWSASESGKVYARIPYEISVR